MPPPLTPIRSDPRTMAAVAVKPEGQRRIETAEDNHTEVQSGVNKLVELLSKLNPSAEEFVPRSRPGAALSADAPVFVAASSAESSAAQSLNGSSSDGSSAANGSRRGFMQRKNYAGQGRRRKVNHRVLKAQNEDCIRRTVYVSEIDQHITEEQLAALFTNCGQVVDCRVCGDPHSVLRFAFIEFSDEDGARSALTLSGTVLGYYPVRVLPSKTAILPVNPIFLPQSENEREMCTRTIYCTNIDKKVSQADLRNLFESMCGEVSRMRLLGDRTHSANIAFVEFFLADSAIRALNCSGLVLGGLPIRVSPSKTPVRPQVPHALMH